MSWANSFGENSSVQSNDGVGEHDLHRGIIKVQGMKVVWVGGMAVRMLVTDVLSTQSTSDPDVVNGISESIVCVDTA